MMNKKMIARLIHLAEEAMDIRLKLGAWHSEDAAILREAREALESLPDNAEEVAENYESMETTLAEISDLLANSNAIAPDTD